jgi:GDP-fucose protein O-fucosyltransferase
LPELYRRLVRDYLQPQPRMVAVINHFIESHLPEPYLALHLRGTDKESEIGNLSEINRNLLNTAKTMATQNGLNKVFVMTDCIQLEHAAKKVLGGKAVFYSSRRSMNRLPLHLNNNQTSSEHGCEILIESYIAARADCFVGNGASNVTAMIAHLRDWSESQLHLLVPNQLYAHNPALYRAEKFL